MICFFLGAKVLQSCYGPVTLMLQSCYKRRCNHSITRLKRFCNMRHLSLQCQPLTVDEIRIMNKEKAEKIQRIFNWVRFILLVLLIAVVFMALA